ncbi:MAG: DUF1109 domain-containing protein [Aquabacterium sp.]|nr:DUF1109 domain-containing protein [Aquabacterium sp.]
MRTDALIDMLARDAGPVPRALAAHRLSTAAAAGLLISAGVAVAWFGAIPAQLFATAVPWTKMAYAASLALATAWLTARLARPAASADRPWRATAGVLLAMVLVGGASLNATPAGARLDALLGQSWSTCPWRVLALSMPALAASLWAVRGLAPTRLRNAGFAAGLLAGSVGAFGYSLACPEASPAFVAVWYTLGIGLTGCFGAVLGPRVLRW